MQFTNIRELTAATRSYRSFDEGRPISRAVMTELVDHARLVPSSANLQPLKYRICSEQHEVEEVLSYTRWAGYIRDITLPPEGRHPTGFIVICHDTRISAIGFPSSVDVGLAAQTILLAATERGYGGCIIGSFGSEDIARTLSLAEHCTPVLVIALGTPDETVILTEPAADGGIRYFRDDAGIHFVPKRLLKDVLID